MYRTVSLTPSQFELLDAMAKKTNMPKGQLIMQALINFEMPKPPEKDKKEKTFFQKQYEEMQAWAKANKIRKRGKAFSVREMDKLVAEALMDDIL